MGSKIVYVAVTAALILSGCTERPVGPVTLEVSPGSALADSAIQVKVSGLSARERITITMRAAAYDGTPWSSHADFVADASGAVDLGQRAPVAGTYDGIDPMGLVWSMGEDGSSPDAGIYSARSPEAQPYYDVHIAVTEKGRELAKADLRRTWLTDGATARAYADSVVGVLYLPPPGKQSRTGVLAFGGSEGGNSMKYTAAVLASHGYPALSLAYFGTPGLPANLRDIPIEYFTAAIDRLRRDANVDRVVLMGYSRGTEAALLTAVTAPAKVGGLVLYAPSNQVFPSLPGGAAAWTLHGEPQQIGPIAVQGLRTPVLAIAGGKDGLWPSEAMAIDLGKNIPTASPPRLYPEAGHLVGTLPYLPTGTQIGPRGGTAVELGGSRQADERAREDSWPRVLDLIAGSSSSNRDLGSAEQGAQRGGFGGGFGDLGGRVAAPGDAAAGPQVQMGRRGGHGPDGQAEVDVVGADPAQRAHARAAPDRFQRRDLVQGRDFRRAGDRTAGADRPQQLGQAGARAKTGPDRGLGLPQVAPMA
jgi:pimeloyl-ACP methyl ester carboxylesterase